MALTNISNEERLLREQQLVDRLIEPHNQKPGYAESILVDNGTSVWVVIRDWLFDGDLGRVRGNWGLTEEAIDAVIAYYRRHKQVIDARITFIASEPQFTPPVIYSLKEREKLVFLVEARPVKKLAKPLRPGQPVDVALTS